MKKYLSILGVVSLATSTGLSSIISFTNVNSSLIKQDDIYEDIFKNQNVDLEQEFNNLSENDKLIVEIELTKIVELDLNSANELMINSSNNFIKTNRLQILEILQLDQIIDNLNTKFDEQNLNIDWNAIKGIFDIFLTESNDYSRYLKRYNPSKKWKVWEWGVNIHFGEGNVNIMRVVKMVLGVYNVFDLQALKDLLILTKDYLDYLLKMKTVHKDDLVEVLYNLTLELRERLELSKLPIKKEFLRDLDKMIGVLKTVKNNLKVSTIASLIEMLVKQKMNVDFQEYVAGIHKDLNSVINTLDSIQFGLHLIKYIIPAKVMVKVGLKYVVNGMVNNDKNLNGVYFKLQNFVIPLGWYARWLTKSKR